MMKIAILGATSQIAKDLIVSFSTEETKQLHLFARRPDDVKKWLNDVGLSKRYLVDEFGGFGTQEFDAIINFVGVGNPAQAAAMGASIFDVTLQYDELALNYINQHQECRYVFLSSGAAYGSSFHIPVDVNSKATIALNDLQPTDWYAVAKLHAECRHRSLAHLSIIDIRVFNYFSHAQDMDANFLITDIARAIRDDIMLKTSQDQIMRDFIGPDDFYQLVNLILYSKTTNVAVDCYSKAPIDKLTLLREMQILFGLQYEIEQCLTDVGVTDKKMQYYSLNKMSERFGYASKYTSLECIKFELSKFFKFN